MVMLKRKGEEPFGMLARYLDWFDRSRVACRQKRSSLATAQLQQVAVVAKRQRYDTPSAAAVYKKKMGTKYFRLVNIAVKHSDRLQHQTHRIICATRT
jgi:hypothetical protein